MIVRLKSKDPHDWVAEAGLPCPSMRRCHDGMPAYESESGTLLVMETLIAFFTHASANPPLFMPRSYNMAALRSQGDGLTALHDSPDAVWSWRPLIYEYRLTGMQRFGSQQELEWRIGMFQVLQERAGAAEMIETLLAKARESIEQESSREEAAAWFESESKAFLEKWRAQWLDEKLDFQRANERAAELLHEHLSPQQRLEYAAFDYFHVRGQINRLYRIERGNGFGIVDPETHEVLVTLCLHPEDWMPHDDVALATKLAIDDGLESEKELLEAARPRMYPRERRANTYDRVAARLERELAAY